MPDSVIDGQDLAKKWLKDHFKLGNLVVLAFVLGGFYYITPEAIDANSKEIQRVEKSVLTNSEKIQEIQQTYVNRDDLNNYVKQQEIINLRQYVGQRMDRIEQQLDILIKTSRNRND